MKKVLFATTALVASAGIAAADIAFSGKAEMGIKDNGSDVVFHTDWDLNVKMTGTTDNGLTFGASFQINHGGGSNVTGGNLTADNESVFISGAFGTLTMGEIDGAYDWAMQEVALAAGSIADNETAHGGFNGNSGLDGSYDNQIARWDYSMGALGVAVSAELDDSGVRDPILGVGVKYDFSGVSAMPITVSVGYQASNDITGANVGRDIWGASVKAGFGGGFSVAVNYSVLSDDSWTRDQEHVGIGIGYESGPWAFGANWGRYNDMGGVLGADVAGWGAAVNYDLGGGAVIQAGVGDDDSVGRDPTWSFGLALSF